VDRLRAAHLSALSACPDGKASLPVAGENGYDSGSKPEIAMSLQAVLAPLFVQVALTFALLIAMAMQRGKALNSKQVRYQDIALRQPKWPERATQIANAFHNQLEVPLLFYVLTILVLFTRQADLLFVLLAWVFVALRLMQAYVHVTSNYVPYRGMLFGAGAIVLLAMWIAFALRIFLL
jgi:hypothetical protein